MNTSNQAPVAKLTHKQESFAQAIVDGLNQSDAYRHAYDSSDMKPATIANSAYKLIQDGDIAARIQELQTQIAEMRSASRLWDMDRAMSEVETNLIQSRQVNQMGPAAQCVKQGIELSGLTQEPERRGDVHITKVTVVLAQGTETIDVENYTASGDEPSQPSPEEERGP